MKLDQKQQIKQELSRYIKVSGSQNKAARQLGISTATLSNVLNEKWGSIATPVWNRLKTALGMDGWQIFKTQNFNIVQNVCEDGQQNARFLAVAGATGYGKTAALRYYAKHNPNAFYVLGEFTQSQKDFIRAVQKAIGIQEEGTRHEMMRTVTDHLNKLEKPLLIFDDVGKVYDSNFRLLQLLYDQTEFHAGIVVAGTEYLKEYIDKMAARNKMGFRELRRRIEYWQPMFRPTAASVKQICLYNGIEEEDAIRFVAGRAGNYGSLRALIRNAQRAANGAGITRQVLAQVSVGDENYEIAHNS